MKQKRKMRTVVCGLCGEPFETDRGNAKYCSETCRKVKKKRTYHEWYYKRAGHKPRVGEVEKCQRCGGQYVVKCHNQKYCKACSSTYDDWFRGAKRPMDGSPIECKICGEMIERTTPNQVMCLHRCEPKPGIQIKCIRCGELKGYDSFYDYRGREGSKGFISRCRECQSVAVRACQKKRDKKTNRK